MVGPVGTRSVKEGAQTTCPGTGSIALQTALGTGVEELREQVRELPFPRFPVSDSVRTLNGTCRSALFPHVSCGRPFLSFHDVKLDSLAF
jgi:hypothetical protein